MRLRWTASILALATSAGLTSFAAPPDPPGADVKAPATKAKPRPKAAAAPGQPRAKSTARPTAPRLAAKSDAPITRTQATPGAKPDTPVRRTQATGGDLPNALPTIPPPVEAISPGRPLGMEAALYGALTGNPDLLALRQNLPASKEALEVARRFPTTLNPTLWVDIRPLTYEPVPGARTSPAHFNQRDPLYYVSLRQPIERGNQTAHRTAIAMAAYDQARWTIVQAEMLALVQTYRFFQTAAYRRERLRVARSLAEFNERLVKSLEQRLESNQPGTQAADVALATVENESVRQQVEAAQQDYVTALTDLRNQIGMPETAGTAEPLGEFILPPSIALSDDQAFVRMALQNRPEIHAARAQMNGAKAAIRLAKGDQKATPIIGPVYERDQAGVQFLGFVYITPIQIINNGAPLVRQREAEYRRACETLRQVEQRTVAQVLAALAKWNGANQLVSRTEGLRDTLKVQVARIERLFEDNQTDLSKLLQARQRLIQLENAQLDAIWAATQAQADLLTALGTPSMIGSLRGPASHGPPGPTSGPLPAPPAANTPMQGRQQIR